MNLVDVVAAMLFAGVVLYAVFAGADFGSGMWDLTAGSTETGGRLRRLVDHAIGPVWEANHVWLIFVLVFLWTGFPTGFAAIMGTLAIPFWLAGLGIVLRGSAFAFRKVSPTVRWARIAGITFATSSVITPFFFGAIAGGIASGRVPAEGSGEPWTSWLNPTSLIGGTLAVMTCTFLAGVFLTADAEALGAHRIAAQMRHRTTVVGAATGAVALAAILPLSSDAPTLFDRLAGRGLGLVALSAIAGTSTLLLLHRHRTRLARVTAVVAVGSIVVGWGVAQYPWLLVDSVSLTDGAAERSVLWGLVLAFGLALVLVLPALIYLFRLVDRNEVGSEHPTTIAEP